MYPNPTHNQLRITGSGIEDISVTNIAGTVIHKEDVVGNNTTINTGAWPAGIYIASIHTYDGQVMCRKIFKE